MHWAIVHICFSVYQTTKSNTLEIIGTSVISKFSIQAYLLPISVKIHISNFVDFQYGVFGVMKTIQRFIWGLRQISQFYQCTPSNFDENFISPICHFQYKVVNLDQLYHNISHLDCTMKIPWFIDLGQIKQISITYVFHLLTPKQTQHIPMRIFNCSST